MNIPKGSRIEMFFNLLTNAFLQRERFQNLVQKSKIVAVLLIICPNFLSAKTFNIQSGEHSDFSRVVVLYGNVPKWTMGRVNDGYELRPDDQAADYNLANVYKLMPKDRITTVETRTQGRLFFAVNCDCYADVFEIRNGLVIDIKDNRNGILPKFERSLVPIEMDISVGTAESPNNDDDTKRPSNSSTVFTLDSELSHRFLGQRTNFAWTDVLAVVTPKSRIQGALIPEPNINGSSALSQSTSDRVSDVQQALIAQLSRAATQGLVSIDISQTENTLGMANPEIESQPRISTLEIVQAVEAISGPNVRIETAMDRGEKPNPDRPAITADGEGCLPSEDFDVANWGVEPENGSTFNLPGSAIFGEFDTADPQKLAALAKNYIYLTFGAETKALVAAFASEIKEPAVLLALAEIMDLGVVSSPFLDSSQMACDTDVAMWAVLSNPIILPGDNVARVAVLRTFAELPLHLRRHLGPLLADQFLGMDDIDTATAIRDAIARAPGKHGDAFEMMEAKISLKVGDEVAGIKQLDEIAAQDGTLAPAAIVQRIDRTLDDAGQLPDGIITTAAAMAFEARGTEIGTELMRAYLRSLAYSEDLRYALDETNAAESDKNIYPDAANSLRLEISYLALASKSDTVFLQIFLGGQLDLDQSDEAKTVRRKAAARMIDLSLPANARELLSETEGIPHSDDRKLFASSFLKENRPELAIGYLAGLTDVESKQLRAESHSLAGEYDRATEVYAEIDDANSGARAAWRGKNWVAVSETGTEAERAASKLIIAPEPNPSSAAGPLAFSRELLARSQDSRQRLRDLLTDIAIP